MGAAFRNLVGPLLVLALLLPACQSPTPVAISPESSLLAVDVRFPEPLGRDPSLVQAFFVRGPIHSELDELPELIPATFVKWERAYLLDPEPGTYSLVAVSSALAPPWNDRPIAGVTRTRWSGTSSDALILPAELIGQTRTTIGRGGVAFMGALVARPGQRIQANAVLRGDLQRRLAERVRPGATDKSGLAGWLARTWTVDPEESSFRSGGPDREAFLAAALDDLGESAWAQVVARAAPAEVVAAAARPAPRRAPPRPEHALRRAGPAEPDPAADAAATAAAVRPEPAAEAPGPLAAVPIPERAPAVETAAEAPIPEREPDAAVPIPEPAPAVESALPIPDLDTEAPAAQPVPAAAPAAEVVAAAPEPEPPAPAPRPLPGLPPESPLAAIEIGMDYHEVREILGPPDDRIDRTTSKAWIPFYTGPGAYLRDWVYAGEGRVVFSLDDGSLEVIDVVHDPAAGR